jgi:hypothetical protein
MRYYWNLVTKRRLEAPGRSIEVPAKSRMVNYATGVVGRWRKAWECIDRLFGGLFFDTAVLLEHTRAYQHVVVVQTANWGFQERFLAFCARKLSLRSILLPYTTDQLMMNGYLLSRYDRVCTQGPVETRYVTQYHGVPDRRVCPLGMLWIRNIESFLDSNAALRAGRRKRNGVRVLLYSGQTSTYFPRTSELEAVDRILEAIDAGVLPHTRLIYRPVVDHRGDLDFIRNRYRTRKSIEIQIPQQSFIGVSGAMRGSVRQEIAEYFRQITQIDVLVMSATNTMMFDALHLGVPCIANFVDPSLSLQSVGMTDTYILNDETLKAARGLPIARSFEELTCHIREALDTPDGQEALSQSLFASWDYRNENYVTDFLGMVESLRNESSRMA